LCERICFPDEKLAGEGSVNSNLNGERFVEWLQASNLFVIPLDDQHEWYRYHHLFQSFLQEQLIQRFEPGEIEELHTMAGNWFAQNGWNEEALHHFLALRDTTAAIELVAQYRYKLMNEARWSILDNWLNLFSDPVIEHSPELWMLKTWLAYHQGRRNELPALLEWLETMLVQEPNQDTAVRLAGEIQTLRSLILFHSGKIEDAVSQARVALKHVPSKVWNVRSLARLYLSGGLLMLGDQRPPAGCGKGHRAGDISFPMKIDL
jgi:LuxR family maltose regulon positive regulatory protein